MTPQGSVGPKPTRTWTYDSTEHLKQFPPWEARVWDRSEEGRASVSLGQLQHKWPQQLALEPLLFCPSVLLSSGRGTEGEGTLQRKGAELML